MELSIGDIKIGYRFKCKDEYDGKWYLSEIVGIAEGEIIAKDIDPNSDYQGMKFEVSHEEFTDKTYCKSI